MDKPVFHHLWFLCFLCWMVAGFALYALLADRLGWRGLPGWMMLSPLRYAWLIPLTLLPQLLMGREVATFGADLSAGWLPKPHVLAFYAIFFAFGALYFDSDDREGRVGRRWVLSLSFGALVLFPLALVLLGKNHELGALVQAAYPWVMTFGLMGLFRRLLSRPSSAIRYLSDSAYWLYLAHLPLVIAAQDLLQDWNVPSLVKFIAITAGVTLVLLAVYQLVVRDRWVGRLLNGSSQYRKGTSLLVTAR